MAPWSRRLRLSSLAVLPLSVVVASGAGPSTPAAAQDSPGAIESLGGCLVSQKVGDVLLLLDQSASLETTDPDDARVTSAAYLAESLATFASANNVDLGLAVGGFDVDFDERSGWTSVRDGDASSTVQALSAMRDQKSGFETDYWTALEGARQVLRDRAASEAGENRCQAIVWFSDGRYELDARTTADQQADYGLEKPYAPGVQLVEANAVADVEAAGRESLCREGGLADGLRSSDIRLLGVGLQANSEPEDFGFMRSVATGADGSQQCGAIQTTDSGSFILAPDVQELILAFDSLGSPDRPPLQKELPACDESGCPEGQHSVVLDSSVRTVRIVAGSDLPDAAIELRSPASPEPVVLIPGEPGSQSLRGVAIDWRWIADTTAEIVLLPDNPEAPGWAGAWSVTFLDPTAPAGALTRTNIHVEGDLVPALLDPVEIRADDVAAALTFGLIRRGSDEEVDLSTIESAVSLTATIEFADGSTAALLEEADAASLDSPVSVEVTPEVVGEAVIDMQLDVTTSSATGPDGDAVPGTELASQVARERVSVLPPLSYPTISQNVDFGTSEGTGPLAADLLVSGPGCVWLDGATTASSPDGIGEVVVATESATSVDGCLRVGEGEQAQLPLALTVEKPGNGPVTGTIVVRSSPLDQAENSLQNEVGFLADLRKPVNETVRTGLTVALVLLGGLIPLLLVWLVAWWQTKVPAGPLLVALIGVEVRGGSVTRTDTSGPLQVLPQELHQVDVLGNGSRRLDLPVGGVTVQSVVTNPLDPVFRVQADGREVRETSAGAGDRLQTVPNSWAVVYGSGVVSLLVILRALGDVRERDELMADATSRLPALARGWSSSATESEVATDPWGDAFSERPGGPASSGTDGEDPFFGDDSGGDSGKSPW